jgi:hypothetical protein
MSGNVWEWIEDCWHDSYAGALADGSAWTTGDCSSRALRGGSWDYDPQNLRSANRFCDRPDDRDKFIGFRVARGPPAVASPTLQAGQQISVTVHGEASLSGNYQIDPAGFVSIPLAGRINAASLSPPELADILVKKFRGEYLKDPKVIVSVAGVRGLQAGCRFLGQ